MEDVEWSQWFYYDPTSKSHLRWKVDRINVLGRKTCTKAGDEAGSVMPTGHYNVMLFGRNYPAGRIVLEIFGVAVGDNWVDHIDGDPSNNSPLNLRVVDASLNARNKGKSANNTSGVTCVSHKKHDGRESYVAQWREGGKQRNRSFSIKKYGKDEAFRLACEFRERKVRELNSLGYGYSERHGKSS